MTNETNKERCEITIRRPNGKVEVVVHPTIPRLNDVLFAKIKQANRSAGKGECISYHNVCIADMPTTVACDRCGATMAAGDGHEFFVDWKGVKNVKHTYCEKCYQLHVSLRG